MVVQVLGTDEQCALRAQMACDHFFSAAAAYCACYCLGTSSRVVVQVLGTDELYNYLSKYGIELDPQLENLVGRHARRPWSKFTNSENAHLVTPEGMDFLDKLLKYDHQVQNCNKLLKYNHQVQNCNRQFQDWL